MEYQLQSAFQWAGSIRMPLLCQIIMLISTESGSPEEEPRVLGNVFMYLDL